MNNLNAKQIRVLAEILEQIERLCLASYGLKTPVGGFVNAEYSSHDADYIYFEVKSGIQSDVQNDVSRESMHLSFNIFDDVVAGKTSVVEAVSWIP